MSNIKEIIKATLFVSGEGIDREAFQEKLNISKAKFDKIIEELKNEMSGDAGIHLIEYKNKIQLCSNPDFAEEISNILNPIREKALTKAALETIAIIAYKQPITKLEVEEIRGVNSADYAIQILTQHNLIEVVGRKDAVGKPLLYGTTDEFLKRFDLKDLSDLPNYDELLERIKLIREENENINSTDGLYRDFKLEDTSKITHENSEEDSLDLPPIDDIPDFLKDEQVEKIESENA